MKVNYAKTRQKNFKEMVFAIVQKIPKGKVLTYKQVAEKAGNGNASRAVGSILKNNADKNIPCHRVIRSDGKVGDYNGLLIEKKVIKKKESKKSGTDAKLKILRSEGVNI